MAIEFRCETCGKLLRTGPENAGRGAKCPGCGDTLAVPNLPPAHAVTESMSPAAAMDKTLSRGLRVAPHRGGLILAFGILSWATCFLFGIAAWAMGAEDLHAMRSGEMDTSGEAITKVGMYLGMANVALMILLLLGIVTIAGVAIFLG